MLLEIYLSLTNHPGQLSLAIPLWVGAMSTGQRWRFGAIGSDVGQINEVTLRQARLVLGWVTVSGFNSW